QRVEPRPVAATHVADATLEAVSRATIAARVSGRILAMAVDAGDRVRAGEVLARIDMEEAAQALAAARARVAETDAAVLNARAAHARALDLFARKFVSQAALDQARLGLDAAHAQAQAARAERDRAAAALDYGVIVAPQDGVVATRHAEAGEMAQPGMPLLTLFDPRALRAVVDLPLARLGADASAGLEASVELPDSGRRVAATRVTVLPAADARTHTVRARVDLPPDLVGVVPGQYARVHFATGQHQAIRVPVAAIVRRSEITAVYVADARRAFTLRQIRVGSSYPDGTAEVLAGLAGGEDVALDPVAAGIAAHAARTAAR
ncbi:MAG: efflux RND transporter periplasmic adaptor subunit, partial [Rhodocyclales bacterium]|nr:efflux RND transporter periplasmic adaptor subunit [Rhodocyclales bacterium]